MYTIKDLTEGRINIEHNGTVKQLHAVIKAAFPNDVLPGGTGVIYGRDRRTHSKWSSYYYNQNAPVISCTELYDQLNNKINTNSELFPIY